MRTVSALKMVWMARVPRSAPPASCCRAWGISSSAVLGMRNRGAIWKPCACAGGGATLAAMGAPMPGVRYWFCSPFTAKVAVGWNEVSDRPPELKLFSSTAMSIVPKGSG